MSKVWKYGDNVDTDLLAPGAYMKGPIEELAAHCLEAIDLDFARQVQPGDVIVAGRNFGIGSSREQAAEVLVRLGVKAVIAKSFGGIFYRNAFNLGLLALVADAEADVEVGHELELDPASGTITNKTTGATIAAEPVPEHLRRIVAAGGLVPYLEQRLEKHS
ncbi:3-isopropylmalate dehydratase small subunit [Nisaea acidiphila]|uniref:3-isopropylmalate dehydratase n=1 Tax=Nisaea acidiphila TaxID=1862145 RepID=A0A9J7AR32_9PROT|nr:3-isopropylmalate dehydratase small subunit [Nisaea acidiphila]UUX49041.1 3-isopropylmalate dehydratase small subunit [Nisaea acidiphila]